MTAPSGDEILERMRMVLAELGYTDPHSVWLKGERAPDGWEKVSSSAIGPIPAAVWWQACELVYENHACWGCFSHGDGMACSMGNCQEPGGRTKPPRELLQPRRAS